MNQAKILIVEDEFIVADDIEARLLDLGYTVVGKVDSGAAAIDIAGSLFPDLVLMDIRLQGSMDGITAATEIRRRFKLPVVFLTAYADDSTLQRAKEAEPFGYILKPFEDRELRTNIEIALYKHNAEAEIRRLNRLYATLSQVNQAIVRVRPLEELFPKICQIALKFGQFKAAWIGRLDAVTGALVPIAKAGDDAGVVIGEPIVHCSCTLAAIQQERPCLINDLSSDPRTVPCRELAGKVGLRACASYPIRLRNQVYGVLVVGTAEAGYFNDVEMRLLDEMALDISSALDRLETERQRREAETALRQSELRYRSLFENMAEGLVYYKMLFDDRGRPVDFIYLDVNSAFRTLTGLENVVGKKVTEVIPGIKESNPELFETYGRVALTGQPERFETEVKSLGIWYSVSAYSSEREHFVAVFDNITDRKRAELKLSESQERLKIAMDAAKLGVWSRNLINGEIFWDERARAIYGMAPDAVITYETLPNLIVPEDRELYTLLVPQQYQKEERDLTIEFRIIAPDGTIRWIQRHGSTTRDASGRPIRRTGVVMDITEKKLAEQQMRALEGQLRQAQKMEAVGRLAGGIAHDFNNLLMVIQSYTEMLQDHIPAPDTLRKNTQQIMKACERAASLTRQMLAYSRKQILSPVVLDLNAVIDDTAKMLRRLIGEDIDFRVSSGESLWTVLADPDQIVQVLMNLCVNARDAMPQGGTLTIATGNATVAEGGIDGKEYVLPEDYVWLSVTDTGTGISKELQERIFEPFFTTKAVGKGTGLGLATVYGIVKQSGGYVWVDSELGQGACFTIYLPRVKRAIAPAVPAKTEAQPQGIGIILFAEDEAALREAMCDYLRSLGYTVLAAGSGKEALSVASEHEGHIDLLITDLVMPGMSGRQLAQMLGNLRPNLKTIFMSGYSDDAVLRHGIPELGATFLQKPFSLGTLARKVRDTLGRTETVQ